MTSTNVTIGFGDRSSSRVTKPPGGQSMLAFGGEEVVRPNPPRPKYDQQNSSNLFGCMGAPEPLKRPKEEAAAPPEAAVEAPTAPEVTPAEERPPPAAQAPQQSTRGRVPPGGFSAGFW